MVWHVINHKSHNCDTAMILRQATTGYCILEGTDHRNRAALTGEHIQHVLPKGAACGRLSGALVSRLIVALQNRLAGRQSPVLSRTNHPHSHVGGVEINKADTLSRADVQGPPNARRFIGVGRHEGDEDMLSKKALTRPRPVDYRLTSVPQMSLTAYMRSVRSAAR